MDGRMKILFVVLFHFACMVVLPLFALTVHESPDVYNALRLDGSGIISEPAGHIPICCTNGMSLTGPNVVYWADGVPSGGDDIVVELRLSITDARKADVRLHFGDLYFGLCGNNGKMYVKRGLIFCDVARDVAKLDSPSEVTEGKSFAVKIERKSGIMSAEVSGQRIFSVRDFRPSLGAIGIEPGKGIVNVERFEIGAQAFASRRVEIQRSAALAEFARSYPVVDLSSDKSLDHVVAAGTPEVYQGHPTSVVTSDGRIIAVWSIEHGGPAGQGAESKDGGRTWMRIDDRFPLEFKLHVDCPSIYRLIGPDGKSRLWVWSQSKMYPGSTRKNHYNRDYSKSMPSIMSEDEGRTWREMPPLGGQRFRCKMAFTSIERLKDGSYIAVFHRDPPNKERSPLVVLATVSRDGGFSWSDPQIICRKAFRDPCEPCLFRSPDGKELCCICRENLHVGNSLMVFSCDEGRTWSEPEESPWALSGDRHQGIRLKDGRLMVVFRDKANESPTYGHFVAWVGAYEAIHTKRTDGTFRIKLLHSYDNDDCGYPGIAQLPDGKIMALTYVKYAPGRDRQSVIAKVFDLPPLPQINGEWPVEPSAVASMSQ